jgi:hypothetical protein
MAFLGLNASGYEVGIQRAQAATKRLEKSLNEGSFAKTLQRYLGPAAIGVALKSTIDLGSQFADMAARAGTSTDAIQQWSYAAKQNGTDINSVVGFFEKLGVAREEALQGNEESIASFARLGVTLDDLKSKRIEDIGKQIGNTVKQGDIQKLIGALRDVGGKGAGELVTAFKAGLDGLLADAPLITAEDIIGLDDAGDAIDAFLLRIKVALAPMTTWLAKMGQDMMDVLAIPARGLKDIGRVLTGTPVEQVRSEGQAWLDKLIDGHVNRWKEKAQGQAILPPDTGGSSRPQKMRSLGSSTESVGSGGSLPSSSGLSINSLQQIGAKVAFSPLQNQLQENSRALQNATSAIRELTTVTKLTPPIGPTGGAEY